MRPKVSIITVVYNNAKCIADAIRSVLDQTAFSDIEYIIVDGQSSDGTIEVIKSFGPTVAKLLVGKDKGIYDAMNKGLSVASGEIIGTLNSDDFLASPQIIEKVIKTFQTTGCDALYGDLMYVDKEDTNKVIRYWKSGGYKKGNFRYGWMPPHPTFYAKRECFEQFGLFDLEFTSAADYELMLRFLFKYNARAAYLPEVMVKMRVGGKSNQSLQNRLHANKEDRRAWHKNNLPLSFYTIPMKPLRKLPQFIFSKLGWFPKGV